MNRYKTLGLSIVVLVIGVVGFAFFSSSSSKTPEAILLGNPTELPASLRSELPTGYRWQMEKDLPFDITEKPDDTRALFVLDENTDNIDEIMVWAAKNGKEEVYFFYHQTPDPEKVVRYEEPFDISALFPKIEWADFEKFLLPFVTIQEAWADWLVPPPENPCVHGCVPANWCIMESWPSLDDDPSDGRVPSLKVCFKFQTNDVYRFGMYTHIFKNVGVYLYSVESNPASLIDCMKFHQGENYIKRPVGLTAFVYKNLNNIGPCSGACGCAIGNNLTCKASCNCSGVNDCTSPVPGPPPLKSYDGEIHIVSESCERDGGNRRSVVSRHELMHLYDFGHCHFDQNKRSTGHCIGLRQASCGVANEIYHLSHVWY